MSAFNGAGTFVISGVGLPFVTGTTISSTVANQLNTDLATGLSTCLTKDGQSLPVANIPMGGFKLTGLAVPTTLGDALSFGNPATVSAFNVTNNSVNALVPLTVLNNNAGNAAAAGHISDNGTNQSGIIQYGTGFTTAGAAKQNGARLFSGGPGGLVFDASNAAGTFDWWTAGASRMTMNVAGQLSIAGTPNGANKLSINGGLFTGDIQGSNITLAPAGVGTLECRGFGLGGFYTSQGLNTQDGNGIRMICVSSGVILANGASSWAAISEKATKKDLTIIPGVALDIVAAHEVKLGRYLTDDPSVPLRPFLFYDDAIIHYPWATVTQPANTVHYDYTDPQTGVVSHLTRDDPEFKGLSLEQYVPLLVKALQEQIAINASLDARLTAGGL